MDNTSVSPVDKKEEKKVWLWIVIGLVGVSFAFGVAVGAGVRIKKEVSSKPVEISKVLNLYGKSQKNEVDFNQFWSVWDRVKEKYVDQPVVDSKLFYGAIEGLVKGLDDQHSVYFPPKEADEFAKGLSGELEGIGAEIGIRDGIVTVIAPLAGSPAEKSGLKPGDKILQINDEETFEMTLDKAVSKIRGPAGSQVVLTITRDGLDEADKITITRAKITVPTVIFEMKENDVAYLRVTYLNQDTWKEFDKTIPKLLAKSPKAIVLDLRSDPGGYLETAIDIASEWVPEGVIVMEKMNGGQSRTHYSTGRHRLVGIKTVVLVDGGSASGAEIIAGALQDYGVATLVGQKTYGKGSVQDFEVLPDGSALKLTIARWHTPKDRQIDKEGIMPDVVLEKMFEKVEPPKEGDTPTIKDFGLEKALEILDVK